MSFRLVLKWVTLNALEHGRRSRGDGVCPPEFGVGDCPPDFVMMKNFKHQITCITM